MAANMTADTDVLLKDTNFGLVTLGNVCIQSKYCLFLGQFVSILIGSSGFHLCDVVFTELS